MDNPDALAFDSSGNLYVANVGNDTVEMFAPGSTTASATYSAGLDYPEALAFDSSGNLYVANYGNTTVEMFAPGSTTASATYSAGLDYPDALAIDSSGNLYVANYGSYLGTIYGGEVRAGEHDGQRHLLRRCVPLLFSHCPGIRLQRQPVRGH